MNGNTGAYEALNAFVAYEAVPKSDPVKEVAITLPVTSTGPVLISTVPHNVWVSFEASPNWFDPLEYITEADS